MVRVAGAVLPHLSDRRRCLAGGAVFVGLGLGIAATGTLISLPLGQGLHATWIGLAALCAVLTAFGWGGWPAPARTESTAQSPARLIRGTDRGTVVLCGVHSLLSVALLGVVVGSFPSGVVPFLGRVHQPVPGRPEAQAAAWGKATIVSALFLALSLYGSSYLFDVSDGNHKPLFVTGICAVFLAQGFAGASHQDQQLS